MKLWSFQIRIVATQDWSATRWIDRRRFSYWMRHCVEYMLTRVNVVSKTAYRTLSENMCQFKRGNWSLKLSWRRFQSAAASFQAILWIYSEWISFSEFTSGKYRIRRRERSFNSFRISLTRERWMTYRDCHTGTKLIGSRNSKSTCAAENWLTCPTRFATLIQAWNIIRIRTMWEKEISYSPNQSCHNSFRDEILEHKQNSVQLHVHCSNKLLETLRFY